MVMQELVATLDRFDFVVVADDDAESISNCRLPKDDDVMSLPSTTQHCPLCFFFLFF